MFELLKKFGNWLRDLFCFVAKESESDRDDKRTVKKRPSSAVTATAFTSTTTTATILSVPGMYNPVFDEIKPVEKINEAEIINAIKNLDNGYLNTLNEKATDFAITHIKLNMKEKINNITDKLKELMGKMNHPELSRFSGIWKKLSRELKQDFSFQDHTINELLNKPKYDTECQKLVDDINSDYDNCEKMSKLNIFQNRRKQNDIAHALTIKKENDDADERDERSGGLLSVSKHRMEQR